jgi:hypothetical protein
MQWTNIESKIKYVLSIPTTRRVNAIEFLQMIVEDTQKLEADGNYLIPEEIKTKCLTLFSADSTLSIPDICGHIVHTKTLIVSTA